VVSNRKLLFQGSIFRGYVIFREGKYYSPMDPLGRFCFHFLRVQFPQRVCLMVPKTFSMNLLSFPDWRNLRPSKSFKFQPLFGLFLVGFLGLQFHGFRTMCFIDFLCSVKGSLMLETVGWQFWHIPSGSSFPIQAS